MNAGNDGHHARSLILVALLLGTPALPVHAEGLPGPHTFARVAGVDLELSGLGALPEGMLIAADELVGSVLFVARGKLRGGAQALPALLVKIDRARKRSEPHTALPRLFAVQDFEGIATDGESAVYLLGSHAPKKTKNWQRRSDREFLIKSKWRAQEQGLRVGKSKTEGVPGIYRNLVDHLTAQGGQRLLRGFNAEGLALRDGTVYIGLRAPLSDGDRGRALIFSAKEKHLFGKRSQRFDGRFDRIELDLRGAGVRGLHWDVPTGKLLVLSGPSASDDNAPHALWSYDFADRALRLEHEFSAGHLAAHGNPEGISRFDNERLLVAFDADAKVAERASLMLLRWR